LKLKFGWEEI